MSDRFKRNVNLEDSYFKDGLHLEARIIAKEMEKALRVVKNGRTTGWTAGISNEIRTDCRVNGLDTEEWCILSGTEYPFASPGDSGALVVDSDGRPGGLFIVQVMPLGRHTLRPLNIYWTTLRRPPACESARTWGTFRDTLQLMIIDSMSKQFSIQKWNVEDLVDL